MKKGDVWEHKTPNGFTHTIQIVDKNFLPNSFSGYWFTNDPAYKRESGRLFSHLEVNWLHRLYKPRFSPSLEHYLHTGDVNV